MIASDSPNSAYDPQEEVHTASEGLDCEAILADIERDIDPPVAGDRIADKAGTAFGAARLQIGLKPVKVPEEDRPEPDRKQPQGAKDEGAVHGHDWSTG